jgi:hypothetical protein
MAAARESLDAVILDARLDAEMDDGEPQTTAETATFEPRVRVVRKLWG